MFAQVTTSLIRVDSLDDFVRKYQATANDCSALTTGLNALFLLVDRSNGKTISLLLGESPPDTPSQEDAGCNLGPIYDQLAISPPIHEGFTVPLFTMFTFTPIQFRKHPYARVTIARSAPDKVEPAISIMRDKVVPAAKEEQGFKGLAALMNRETGKSMTITLWETEEDLEDSEISGYYQQQLSRFGRILTELPLREYFQVAVHVAGA